jgi:hypothetical protein
MDIKAEDDFVRTLTQARDEKAPVEVLTRGGQSLKGLVRVAGREFAVIGPLSGRDFFDAHVRVADVSAICVQVRGR